MTEYSKEVLTEDIEKDVRITAFKVLRNVILPTPVRTGRAKGNWQVGINSAKTKILNVSDKSGAVTINLGSAVIDSAKGFNSIYITNNLPYISSLNDGSSTQAPAKFVETGIKRALND